LDVAVDDVDRAEGNEFCIVQYRTGVHGHQQ
jgi:hypothetical protein